MVGTVSATFEAARFLALEVDLNGIDVVKMFSGVQMMMGWSKMQLILISHRKLPQITQFGNYNYSNIIYFIFRVHF